MELLAVVGEVGGDAGAFHFEAGAGAFDVCEELEDSTWWASSLSPVAISSRVIWSTWVQRLRIRMRSLWWILLRWVVKLVRRGVVSDIVADVDESDGLEGEMGNLEGFIGAYEYYYLSCLRG